jgi:hypothetical protein
LKIWSAFAILAQRKIEKTMPKPNEISICAICGRRLIPGKSVNEHHLIPKTYKGTETILIHIVCHTKIHSVLSEKELWQHYHTPERLQEHPEIAKFISWVKNKDPEFRDRNKPTKQRLARMR